MARMGDEAKTGAQVVMEKTTQWNKKLCCRRQSWRHTCIFPSFLQFLPHLSFHLPDLLPACPLFFLQCAARKRDLCWVCTHRCCVYCPKLRELALKTTSRVLEEDVAHEQRKKNKTRLACIFIYWRGGGGWWRSSDWGKAAPIPLIVAHSTHDTSPTITHFQKWSD